MKEGFFTSKDLVLMSLFGAMSSLAGLTTSFIPAPLPGLYAVIAIPVGTILLLIARDLVGKTGAATFTQFVSGIMSTILPGGPPLIWLILPTWVMGGILIDLFLHVTNQTIGNSRATSGIVGLIYNIPGDLLLYWAFKTFMGWVWVLPFFLYGFIAIHAILGGVAGLFVPYLLGRIKPVVS